MLWLAEGPAALDGAEEIAVEVVNKLDEGRWEAEEEDEVANPVVLEGFKLFIIGKGSNGGGGIFFPTSASY